MKKIKNEFTEEELKELGVTIDGDEEFYHEDDEKEPEWEKEEVK